MKKGLSVLVASMMICSVAFASPTVTSIQQMAESPIEIRVMSESLNQNDSIVLFGTDKVETVALLTQDEMVDTQGAGWFKSIKKYLSKPSTIFSIVFYTATTIFPPTATVSIPGIYSGAKWAF